MLQNIPAPTFPFELTRRDNSANASAIFNVPSGVAPTGEDWDPVPRGFALGAHATDPTLFDVAFPTTYIGHLTRPVRVGGLMITDRVFGVTSETPFINGQEVTIEKAKEIECEGSAYIWSSGVRQIQSTTPVGATLNFVNGFLGIQQGTELVNAKLTANNLPPQTAGNLRIRAEITGA